MHAGALARGDAAVILRFPHRSYREKIWDHCAGAVIVQEAGGVISDAAGDARKSSLALSSPPDLQCKRKQVSMLAGHLRISQVLRAEVNQPQVIQRVVMLLVAGTPLQFGRGRWLDLDKGIVTSTPKAHAALIKAIAKLVGEGHEPA